MKKLISIIFAILVLTGIVFSQSVTIITPSPGTTWYRNGSMDIKWTTDGCENNHVKINIFKNSISQANFILQLAGVDGFKHWDIPKDFSSGNYYMRIKTEPAQNGCQEDSGVFHIKLKTKFKKADQKLSTNMGIKYGKILNTINVWEPVNNSTLEALKVTGFSWIAGFAEYTEINMDLHRENNSVACHILKNYNNCGGIGWAPPEKYAIPGAKYYIRVFTSDNKYSGISGFFYIVPPQRNR